MRRLDRGFRARGRACNRFRIVSLAGDDPNDIIDRNIGSSIRHNDFGEHAFVDRLDLHGRLVGFDFGQHITRLDWVAHLFQPTREVAFFHSRRQGWHKDVDGHGQSLH